MKIRVKIKYTFIILILKLSLHSYEYSTAVIKLNKLKCDLFFLLNIKCNFHTVL